jgi:hypothetical protein
MIEKITNQNQIARHKLAEKINELIDAVNEFEKDREEIKEWIAIVSDLRSRVPVVESRVSILEEHAHPTATTKPAKNAQDRMIGCTTLDIPKSYKNDQLTLATLDYSKKLEKENRCLKDKLEHITDILYESKYALEEITNPSYISHEQQMAQEALDKVNAEIKAITGE